MSYKSSMKRRGVEESSQIPPKKMPTEVVDVSEPNTSDVTIIVEEKKFHCLREELSHHSMYFQKMFNSDFSEKNKKEVPVGGIVKADTFHLFLKVILGKSIVTDETVEDLLKLADYLESATLEAHCMQHLANQTQFSLKDQFQMAEMYHSEKLMIQVCASIKDSYELDEVVPKDLDSFCNTTKKVVLQRSFELLGIRKPPPPPLPEEPDQVFEHLLSRIIDQVDVQNHHGEVLKNQIVTLMTQLLVERWLQRMDNNVITEVIRNDPLIKNLADQLQEAHEQDDRNIVHANILALKLKHLFSSVDEKFLDLGENCLKRLTTVLNQDARDWSRKFDVTLGDRKIDEIHRRVTLEAIARNQEEEPLNQESQATWLYEIEFLSRTFAEELEAQRDWIRMPRPDNVRQVSNRASFRAINDFVRNARDFYYRERVQPERNENHPNQDGNAPNPQEQEQEI